MTIIETQRLRIQVMTEDDAPFYLEMLSDPDFKANIGDRGLHTLDDARASMREQVFASYEAHGFGMYLVKQKSDGAAVGMAGLVKRDFLQDIDVGYAFLPRGRGHGFATEAAVACVEYARDQFGAKRLAAITDPENTASIRVLEKLGFREAGRVTFPDDGDVCAHFLIEL